MKKKRMLHERGCPACTRSASGELGACDSDIRRLELEESNVHPIYGWTAFEIDFVFFFQAEDGIRYLYVTGVQTCALPILDERKRAPQHDGGYDEPRFVAV